MMSEDRLADDFKLYQVYTYMNLEYRLIETRPRRIHYSKEYSCPSNFEDGVKRLESKIRNGDPLLPHLSRQIFNPTAQDGMLFDWGIHHLHLGVIPDPKNPTLVKGNKEILFSIFDDKNAYFLLIGNHKSLTNKEILRIVKRNFPQFIEPHKIKDLKLANKISEKAHKKLRESGLSTLTEIDGSYYYSPGGGINSAKGSFLSIQKADMDFRLCKSTENIVIKNIPQMLDKLSKTNWSQANEINLKMKELEPDRITLIDDLKNLQVILKYSSDLKTGQISLSHLNEHQYTNK